MRFVPSLSRNQLLWIGGAAVLGVTEIVSAPIAIVLGALPVLDEMANDGRRSASSSSGSASSNGRRTGARRTRRAPAASSTSGNGTASTRRTGTRRGTRRRTSTA